MLLSACNRQRTPAFDSTAPIDPNDSTALYMATAQAHTDGREADVEAFEHFKRRVIALRYLGESTPRVQTVGDVLAYERTATEPVSAVEARLTNGISTFDFQWKNRANDPAIVENPTRASATLSNPLGDPAIDGTREIRPGIWLVPWTTRGRKTDAYMIRAIALTHRDGEWTLYRHYVLRDGAGPDVPLGCTTTAAATGQSMWVYCSTTDSINGPERDAALLDRLEKLQLDGPPPELVGSTLVYAKYHGSITAEIKSGDYAAEAEQVHQAQKVTGAAYDHDLKIKRLWMVVGFWGTRLGLFGIPMVGAWLLFRQRGGSRAGAFGRSAWAAVAVVLLVVAWNAAILAHPGRSYPDAWGPAGLVDYFLIAIAGVAGVVGLLAARGALRRPA
ncbi:hypothetical protein KPL74_09255 [Bacillus sp. NP157]|nr:hypothetical protein KPL74_09255 [Bacillus sp. NP157]